MFALEHILNFFYAYYNPKKTGIALLLLGENVISRQHIVRVLKAIAKKNTIMDSVSRLVRQNNTELLEETSKSVFILIDTKRHRRKEQSFDPDLMDTYNPAMIKQEDIFSRAHGSYMNSHFTEETTQMTDTHEMLNSKNAN